MPDNLVALCRNCHEQKLDLPPEEFYTPSTVHEHVVVDRLEELRQVVEELYLHAPRLYETHKDI